jgi:tetratricopeptide (TPR) repeat protein
MTTFAYDPAQGRSGPPGGEHLTQELVRHTEQYLGPIEGVFAEIVSATVQIDVIISRPTPTFPYRVLLTSGLSDLPMTPPAGGEHLRFAELCMVLPQAWPVDSASMKDDRHFWPFRTLRTLCRIPHEYGSYFAFGHTLANGNPAGPYDASTQLSGAVLLQNPNLPAAFHFATLASSLHPEGKRVNIYSLIPLYQDELQFALAHDTEALSGMLGAAQVDGVVRIDRHSACATWRDGTKQMGHVIDAPSGMSMNQALKLHDTVVSMLSPADRASAVNAAARLMLEGQYAAAIDAYTKIGETDPEKRGTAASQIGVGHFFLGRYEDAIAWYRHALGHGEDARMMQDNIEEAEAELRKLGRPIPSAAVPNAAVPNAAVPNAAVPNAAAVARPLRVSMTDTIRGYLAPKRSRKIHLAEDLPPKKQASASRILSSYTAEPVVAFLDITLMGGGDDAVVLTDTMLCAKEYDDRVAFSLGEFTKPEFTGVLQDTIRVTLGSSTSKFACGGHGELLLPLLQLIERTR